MTYFQRYTSDNLKSGVALRISPCMQKECSTRDKVAWGVMKDRAALVIYVTVRIKNIFIL